MEELKWSTVAGCVTLKRHIEWTDIEHLIFTGWDNNHILVSRKGRIWRYNFSYEDQRRIMELMAKIATENPHNLQWTPYTKDFTKHKRQGIIYRLLKFLGVYSFFCKHQPFPHRR